MRFSRVLYLSVSVALVAAVPACDGGAEGHPPAKGGADGLALTGHEGRVQALAFSPDGALVVSGGADGTVRLWDAATGACRSVLEGHRAPVAAVVVSPNGKGVASGSLDGAVRVWSVRTGSLLWDFTAPKAPRGRAPCFAFSPDTRFLATGHATGLLALYDLRRSTLVRLAPEPGDPLPRPVTALAFSADGAVLISATEIVKHGEPPAGRIAFWHRGAAEPARVIDAQAPLDALRLTADGTTLLAVRRTGYVELLAMPACQDSVVMDHGGEIEWLSWARGERVLTTASGSAIRVWDLDAESLKTIEPPKGAAFTAAAVSPDGKRLASAAGDDGRVALRETAAAPGTTGKMPTPEDGEDYGDPAVIEKQIAFWEEKLGEAQSMVAKADKALEDSFKQTARADLESKEKTEEIDWNHPENVGKDNPWDPKLKKKEKDKKSPRATLHVNQPSPATLANMYQSMTWRNQVERRLAALRERLRRARAAKARKAAKDNQKANTGTNAEK